MTISLLRWRSERANLITSNQPARAQEDLGNVAASVLPAASSRGTRYLGGIVAALLVAAAAMAGVVLTAADHASGAAGAEARTGDLAFVVHRVETTDVIADPEYPNDNVSASGRFVVVKLTVTNTSDDREVFHAAFSTLSAGAAQYEVDAAAWHYVGDADRVLGPRESIDAALVFDVPRSADPRAIVLRTEPASAGVSVAL